MLIVFDSETTGLPLWNQPSEDSGQPHIVQIAAALRGFDRKVEPVQIMNRIIKPEGWTIPEEVSKLHGITTEHALEVGVPIEDALTEFFNMLEQATSCIGYNIAFDKRCIRIEEKRMCGADAPDEELPIGHKLTGMKEVELSNLMTKHCNLPPTEKMMAAGRKTAKKPKLEEAFLHAYGSSMADGLDGGAHDAMTDVKATMALYWWLLDRQEIAA